jgi:hypothetical protein
MKTKSIVTEYDSYLSCNKCGGINKIKITDTIGYTICECETKCENCGFEDYWVHGFFESRTEK